MVNLLSVYNFTQDDNIKHHITLQCVVRLVMSGCVWHSVEQSVHCQQDVINYVVSLVSCQQAWLIPMTLFSCSIVMCLFFLGRLLVLAEPKQQKGNSTGVFGQC